MSERLDLLVVGAGPTGIAIGAAARQAGLSVLLVDRGPLTAAIQGFPTYMEFFTTRDRLEIADIPFTIPEDKPNRRQALAYYRLVVDRYGIPLALYEDVRSIAGSCGAFRVTTDRRVLEARAVALAFGYFVNPRRLGVPGEDLPWVSTRYVEPYPYYGRDVVLVGAGNTAAEAALDLWRNGARVTLVHRRAEVKASIKYWLKPDLENRIAEGSIAARMSSTVVAFRPEGSVEISGPQGAERLPAHAAFVLLGYRPDVDFERRSGIELDPETLVPAFDPASCESNVPGLYVAGTLQAGGATDRIFIENSRDHGVRIVSHLRTRLSGG